MLWEGVGGIYVCSRRISYQWLTSPVTVVPATRGALLLLPRSALYQLGVCSHQLSALMFSPPSLVTLSPPSTPFCLSAQDLAMLPKTQSFKFLVGDLLAADIALCHRFCLSPHINRDIVWAPWGRDGVTIVTPASPDAMPMGITILVCVLVLCCTEGTGSVWQPES